MRVLLEHCFDHWSSRALYRSVAFVLRRRGFEVDVRQEADGADLRAYDFFLGHGFLDEGDRELPRIRSWGGRLVSRPESLELVREAGIPIMPWALAAGREEAQALFEHWGVERLLLKRSRTMKGCGVTLFGRGHLPQMEWNPEDDVFCPEIDPDDGTIYKAEIFAGRILLGWTWQRPPLNRDFGDMVQGNMGDHSARGLFRFPASLDERIRALSATLTERGFGYCSLDLMKTPEGELVAIEINTGQVASWWSARFLRVHWRYAGAVAALLSRNGAEARPRRRAG
jgi:hypothetical protein